MKGITIMVQWKSRNNITVVASQYPKIGPIIPLLVDPMAGC